MPTPSAASWRTMRKRRSHSAGERAEVGSSMIRMRASSERALAISTSCCSPMRRPPTRASGSSSMPRRARSFRAAATMARRSRKRPARQRLAAEEDVGGDAELGDEVELLVDDGDARPARRRGRRRSGPARRRSGSRRRRRAGRRRGSSSAWTCRRRSRPSSACTSPARRSKSTRSSAVTPAKCLVTLRARSRSAPPMSAVLVMPAAPLPKCRRSLLPESRQSTS